MDALFETEFCKDLKVVTAPPDIVKTVEKGRASGSDPETSAMVADVMTKCLSQMTFTQHQRALGIFPDENATGMEDLWSATPHWMADRDVPVCWSNWTSSCGVRGG